MSKYDFMFLDVLGRSYQNENFLTFLSLFHLSQFVCESLVTTLLKCFNGAFNSKNKYTSYLFYKHILLFFHPCNIFIPSDE